jgi:hypothetical protein
MARKKDTKTVSQQARDKGLDPGLVFNRMHRGWTLEKALSEPVRSRKKPKKSIAKQKAVVKKIRDTLEEKATVQELEQEVTEFLDDKKPVIIPPLEGSFGLIEKADNEPPLLSEKAESNFGFLVFLTIVGFGLVVAIVLQELGII